MLVNSLGRVHRFSSFLSFVVVASSLISFSSLFSSSSRFSFQQLQIPSTPFPFFISFFIHLLFQFTLLFITTNYQLAAAFQSPVSVSLPASNPIQIYIISKPISFPTMKTTSSSFRTTTSSNKKRSSPLGKRSLLPTTTSSPLRDSLRRTPPELIAVQLERKSTAHRIAAEREMQNLLELEYKEDVRSYMSKMEVSPSS